MKNFSNYYLTYGVGYSLEELTRKITHQDGMTIYFDCLGHWLAYEYDRASEVHTVERLHGKQEEESSNLS